MQSVKQGHPGRERRLSRRLTGADRIGVLRSTTWRPSTAVPGPACLLPFSRTLPCLILGLTRLGQDSRQLAIAF